VPFDHPFGFDYDFGILLDVDAEQLSLPGGDTLGVEVEQGLVPPAYRPGSGDRTVVHGFWIVDCGHNDPAHGQFYHTEIHPPALIATARVTNRSGYLSSTFIAPPYFTQQIYTPDGRTLLKHLLAQVPVAILSNVPGLLTAIPEISPTPPPLAAHYRLRLQTRDGNPKPTIFYHFVHRTGVQVIVTGPTQQDPTHAQVTITLDPAQYKPAPAPTCSSSYYSLTDVDHELGAPDGTMFTLLGANPLFPPVAFWFGVKKIDCQVASPLVPNKASTDNQIVADDNQPYPVFGWLGTNSDPDPETCAANRQMCQDALTSCLQQVGSRGGPTSSECGQGNKNCLGFTKCPLPDQQLAQLTVNLVVVPPENSGRFNLQIDGTNTVAADVGNGGSTGPLVAGIGHHVVGEIPGYSTDASKYKVQVGGNCAADGSITLSLGDNKTCTITASRIADSNCSRQCDSIRTQCMSGTDKRGGPTPSQCAQGFQNCMRDCAVTPPVETLLTVNQFLIPPADSGRFNIQIDGVTKAANAGNQASTGTEAFAPGPHKVGVIAASPTDPLKYSTNIGGDCSADGSITLLGGDRKVCAITITRKPPSDPQCLNRCASARDACTGQIGERGGPTGAQCAERFNTCRLNCS
jgi:hypothetical protein